MADLKYNEFTPGTYDTSKIFLQADPFNGTLEKVNLPAPGSFLTCLLNVSFAGTSDPSADIIFNNSPISGVSPTRDGTGQYSLNLDNFPSPVNFYVNPNFSYQDSNNVRIAYFENDSGTFYFETKEFSDNDFADFNGIILIELHVFAR